MMQQMAVREKRKLSLSRPSIHPFQEIAVQYIFLGSPSSTDFEARENSLFEPTVDGHFMDTKVFGYLLSRHDLTALWMV